jgi:type VI secretion system secreted protein Hcp
MASVDYYLKIDGVDGESTARGFEGWIEIESFYWGATQTAVVGGGGGGAGKVVVSDFTLVKRVDKASPRLFQACVTGLHASSAVLAAKRGDTNATYLKYQLTDVLVSSFRDAGTAGEPPLEEISLNFTRIEFSYAPTLPSGQLGQPITATYDARGRV